MAVEFVENRGQWEGAFRYRAEVSGATAFFEDDCITWVKLQADAPQLMHDLIELPADEAEALILNGHAWKMNFHGTEGSASITAADHSSHTYNYFLGNDPSRWQSGIAPAASITYKNVWPGIDLVFHGKNGNLKYDLVIAPGADPSLIAFTFEGTDGIEISPEGELIVKTSVGDVKELAPIAFHANDRSPIECAFHLQDGKVGFDVQGYDPARGWVIDPELIAATYSGATGASNYGHCATYDDLGNIYTGARSFGAGYPTDLGSFQQTFGGGGIDISLSKLDPDGGDLIWATYLGGSGSEYPHSLIVNSQGQLCVLGSTTSSNFPVQANAFQGTIGGSTDMVVSVLSMDGSALIGSTFIGGSQEDGANAMYANYGEQFRGEIMVNEADDILVASFSRSSDFPITAGAYQTALGGMQDAVVLSLNNTCSDLQWSTFLGGNNNDGAFGLRVIDGNVFVCGQTFSTDLPASASAFQSTNAGGQDGFVARIANNGSQLIALSYFGTADADRPYFLDTDTDGNVWIYGQTLGDIAIQPADVYSEANGTIFLAKFTPEFDQILLSTAFGSSQFSTALTPVAFLVDKCDKIYVSGYEAFNADLPVTGNALNTSGAFYLAAFDVDMAELVFGTFYGGNHVDGGTSRFDKNGIVYQGVCSTGNNMQTTPWAYAPTQQASWDIGVFKIDFQVAGVSAAGASPINQGCAPIEIQFQNTSTGTDWLWDFGDGSPTVSAFEPSHMYTEAGSYTITLIASDSMACNLADTTSFEIEIGVAEPYVAAFTTDQDPSCSDAVVTFTNTSEGSIMQYEWDMGDGTTYTDTNVVHTYASPGTYDVQLNILDPSGCSQPDSVIQPITVVLDATMVDAIAEIDPPGPCGTTVTGSHTSTGVDPTFEWHMGDGTLLQQDEIEHTYAQPGEYTITFIASDPSTCNQADTLTWQIVIESAEPAELEFTVEVQQECTTATVQTINQSIGDLSTYHWDMGDGTEYDQADVAHTYTQPGYYMITLSATDPAGCGDPAPFSVPVFVPEPEPIDAVFTFDQETTCEGTMVTAYDMSPGEDLSIAWDLGNGTISNDSIFSQLFTQGGEYILQLVVNDPSGCQQADTMQQVLAVPDTPVIDATFDHTLNDNCEGGQFIGETINDGPTQIIWDMGDGTTLEGNYIDHQYTQEGEYEVMAVAIGSNGCGSDTAFATVQVQLPVPMELSFDLQEEEECGQSTVTCTNTSIGNDLSFIWWTSDDNSYYGPEMQHTFTEAGTYEIRFYGLDPMGCYGPDSVVVTITVDPVAPIDAEPDFTTIADCDGTSVQATITDASENCTYEWNTGDGNVFTGPDLQHMFAVPGNYTVQLTVSDNNGCSDPLIWSETVEVTEPLIIDAGMSIETTPGCGTLDVLLTNTTNGSPELNWDMGNGDQLVGEAVAYTYDQPGTYLITLVASDPASCNLSDTASMSITVDPLPVMEASFEMQQEGDCGELTVNCTNTSIVEGADHVWIMGEGTTLSTMDAEYTFNSPGTYQIMLVLNDPNGCLPADTAFAEVTLEPLPPIEVAMDVQQTGDCSIMQVNCTNLGSDDGSQWIWNMGDGTEYDTFNASHIFTVPGTYYISLTAIDTVCSRQEIITVPVEVSNGIPVVQLSSPVLCEGSTVTLDASGMQGEYSWSNGSIEESITIDQPGTYTVTVSSIDGCTGTAEVNIEAGQTFTFEETIEACPQETVPLQIPIEGIAYGWSTGGIARTEHVRGPGEYNFVVTDIDGCQHEGLYIVEALDAEAQLFAPNAFTPDGDGINDIFEVQGFGEEAAKFVVYDRWGELLYEMRDGKPRWDGFYNGDLVKQDVYVYQLEYRSFCSNAVVSTTGHVTVVR